VSRARRNYLLEKYTVGGVYDALAAAKDPFAPYYVSAFEVSALKPELVPATSSARRCEAMLSPLVASIHPCLSFHP
jgi:hypothetical protein